MSAQPRQTGPASSIINGPSLSDPHAEHVKSFTGEITTSCGGRLWRSASRARLRSDSSAETQCVRYARSISGSPVLENRSGRRSRVRATYAVSLGFRPPCSCPRPKAAHCGRDSPQARDHRPLEIVHPALPPLGNLRRLQPAHTDQHVDRGHELPLGECRLRRPHHTPLQFRPIPAAHDAASYRPLRSHARGGTEIRHPHDGAAISIRHQRAETV
jgi:hypothetical protein